MKQPPEPHEVYQAMSELFAAAKKCERKALWNALTPTDPELDPNPTPGFKIFSHFAAHEYRESFKCVSELKEVLEQKREVKSRVRLMLAIYCHMMEADFPMAVVWNLLRAVNGQSESWTFKTVGPSGNEVICEYPRQKIAAIRDLADTLGLRIGTILDQLWNPEIRNAFSHSQYCIIGDYVILTKGLSPISRRNMSKRARDGGHPTVTEIEKLYLAADSLVDAFIAEYDMASDVFG